MDLVRDIQHCITIVSNTQSCIIACSVSSILLIISILMYGTLRAYYRLSHDSIELLQTKTDTRSNYIVKQASQPQLLRFHILFTTNMIHVIIAVITLYSFNRIPECSNANYVLITISFILICIFIASKILAYAISRIRPISYIFLTHWLLRGTIVAMYPLYKLFETITKTQTLTQLTSQNVMINIAEALHVSSHEVNQEKEIIEGIAKLQQKVVSNIMTPRVSIFALDIATNFKDLVHETTHIGYSRVPVFSGTLDTIKGILYVKDLLPHLEKSQGFRWQTLIRPAYFIPETKKIDNLLEEFQKTKIHLAVVIDEYGGTSGIVTLEDILEEILGEINDEFDDESDELYTKVNDTTYIFEGKISIHDVCKIIQLPEDFFDSHKGDADSLAGFILELTGDFPKLHQQIIYKHLQFLIEEEDNRRISKIKLNIQE
ncbi:MAG TPA: transporter associated domain-containing protein [Bacteroidales bacterium]|nr:transporter associated domain-containing protein [Bacteroidales bacterium]